MLTRIDIGDTCVVCHVPATTLDVLEFRVRIRCLADDVRRQEAARWFARHTNVTGEELATYAENLRAETCLSPARVFELFGRYASDDVPLDVLLYGACESLCEVAGLSKEVLAGVVAFRDRQSGIKPSWRPESVCTCIRCRWNGPPEDAPDELPPGMTCIYLEADIRSVLAATSVAGLTDPSEPYWLSQLRGAMEQAVARRLAHDREAQEEKKQWSQANDELATMLGGRR